MRIGWSTGHQERASPQAGFGQVVGALERRGLSVEPVGQADEGFDAIILGAPMATFGPEGVRRWRRWAEGGRRLLVLGWVGEREGADIGLVVPGLELADNGTVALRGRAKLEHPTPISPGILAPQGSGWFRFARSLDVLDLRADDVGYRWVHIGLGEGRIGLWGDLAQVGDEAISDDIRPLSLLLRDWLGPLHHRVCAAALAGAPLDLPAPSPAALWTAQTLVDGVAVSRWLRPGGHGHAVKALAEHGLVEAVGGRLQTTESGRGTLDLVATILEIDDILLRADERGRLQP